MKILNNESYNHLKSELTSMGKTITFSDLVAYAYNETDLLNTDSVQRSIDGDPLIQQEFSELVAALQILDDGWVQPSEETINKILAFSKLHS